MRYVWVDSGNDVDVATFEKHDIDGAFFDIDDPRVTKRYLMHVRDDLGLTVGVYVAWNWGPYVGLSGAEFAEAVDARLSEIVPKTSAGRFPKVQFNDETHDPQRIQDLVVRWRQLRKYRDTSWTMEGMQGGWMSPNLVQVLNSRRIRVVPQTYTGNMTPQDVNAVIADVANRGIKAITPHRDAARIQPWPEEGFYFTGGRLPR